MPERSIDPQIAAAANQRKAEADARKEKPESQEPTLALMTAYFSEGLNVLAAWLAKRQL